MIRKATRQGIRPIICLYSESGCGKTYSSLLLARGFVGSAGKIVLADSETGRGELYADVIPGGYDVLPLSAPFSPAAYISAIEEMEASGAAIGIIDSGSHEWEGIGGVLDMAADNEHKSGRAGLHNWKMPKFEHAKFIQKLLSSKIPLVICLRAKFKTRQGKEGGKTVIIKDDHTTPIQADDFIFEATAHGEVMLDHSFRLTKCSHPDLRKCFPSSGPITVHHGELLAAWCGGKPAAPSAASLKKQLWEMTKEQHRGKPENLEAWLINRGILGDTEKLAEVSQERLTGIIAEVESQLGDVTP